ncbi:hypothetical protein MRX96_018818 [Rhipicephalus microplus]
MEQIINFDMTRPTWQEPTLRECVLWKATSCKSYDHVLGRKLLKLPCRSTLQNFKYTLTRALNSDPVESLFSCFHQFNSANDQVDARTAVFTAEKLLKVGILEAARSGNAPSNSECQRALGATKSFHGAKSPAIFDEALAVLWKIQHVMKHDEVPVLFDFTALAYLAGYLAFVCKEKVACPACKLQLKGKASREGAYQFVFSLDQGGLSYPPTSSCLVVSADLYLR